MKSRLIQLSLIAGFLLSSFPLMAQDGASGQSYLVYIMLAVAIIIFLGLIIQVSDNLLAIEARNMGAEKKSSVGLFPRPGEIFPKKLPKYVDGDKAIRLNRGYNILLEGTAENVLVEEESVTTFAIQPPNFVGISPIPKLMVEVGDEVKAGDPILFDKKVPEVKYCAPVSGEVIAVNRGEKRAITEVVILADKEMKYRDLKPVDLDKASREELVEFLLESGAWPLIRQRPYNVVAESKETPRNIFISTFDTAPLAPDLNFVVEGKGADFQKGLDVLNKLTEGKVYLGLDGNGKTAPSPVFTEAKGVEHRWFIGKHPAGNVGVHIHHTEPILRGDKVWTLGVQDVITLGRLFTEKRFNTERVVAVAGAELKAPKYVKTYLGAKVGDLVKDNLANDHVRYISGDVLSGEKKNEEQFLNVYDDQLTVVEEGDYFEMFGWLLPIKARPSVSRTFPNFLFPNLTFKADTNTHGEKRAFVVTGQYEAYLPMDIYLQHLMKNIIINDLERIEGLGIYELVEEDVALCEFTCTSKQPLQQILREGLDMMREQG
jgi:Na+-transporting NADH:ubiquinone oxidoreductase subunit A